MLLYNVTLIVEDGVAQEFLNWMQEVHIPEVMATGHFLSNRILRVVDSPNEGVTFCSQYVAENIGSYQDYVNNHAATLQKSLNDRYEGRFVAYRTLMEYLD
ncbi:DUF4286 domain-containing protein [Pedobacter yulinensis]|uniref:DUF4286 domain-containing protein n=1 Tax=Pedobacter yulinensis TaxID=2126353 RepID=A0A2T3HQE0_9SPHI|nr:DUF4286 family protein [Pedobacter yulinensis]PST84685.1 DUF4286 domain-containing protein [Pedobacter yulinensis]